MTTTYRFRQLTDLATLLGRIAENPRHPVPEPGLRIVRINHGPVPGAPILAHTDEGGTSFASLAFHFQDSDQNTVNRVANTPPPRLELALRGAYRGDRHPERLLQQVEEGFGPAFPAFADEEAAFNWLVERCDDDCCDNFRSAPLDDLVAMVGYSDQIDEGCCGFADYHVYVGDRLHIVGCNYGH